MTGKRIDNPRGKILKAIRDTVRERGYPPSIEEIGAIVGLSSKATVHYHLRVLKDSGLIERAPGHSRAIFVHTPPDAVFEELQAAVRALNHGHIGIVRAILTDLMNELGGSPAARRRNERAAPDAPGAAPDLTKEITHE